MSPAIVFDDDEAPTAKLAMHPTVAPARSSSLAGADLSNDENAPVVDMTYDAIYEHMVTAHSTNELKLWNRSTADTWKVSTVLSTPHAPGALHAIRFAQPSTFAPGVLATCGSDGLAVIYRICANGDRASSRAHVVVLDDAMRALSHVAFSDDGLFGTVGEEKVVRFYAQDDDAWRLVSAVHLYDTTHTGLSFRIGGGACVACGHILVRNGDIDWNVHAKIDDDAHGNITCVDWGATGVVAVGRKSGAVQLWRMKRTGVELLDTLSAQQAAPVTQASWDCAGELLATAHQDKVLRIWAMLPMDDGVWRWRVRDTVQT